MKMFKPNGYDEAVVYDGEFKQVPKGGYICRIAKLEEGTSQSRTPMLLIYLDIAEGEFAGHYAERYKNDTRDFPKWGCIAYQSIFDTTTGKVNPHFKSFLTAVEESNPGFVVERTWGDDFTKFYKDKYIGFVFGDEHYIGNDGKEKVIAKPRFARSVEKIKKGDFKIPDDTYANGMNATAPLSMPQGFENIPTPIDDDLPF